MIEQDTIKLLRECDAGIKMGVQSIEDSLKYTSNGELKRTLEKKSCRACGDTREGSGTFKFIS